MLGQHLRDHLLQDAHAVAVHDADAAGGGHHRAVQEFVHRVARLLGALADHVDLLVHRARVRARACSSRSSAACSPRRAFGQHLDHVVDRDLHLHEAGLHFDAAVAQHAAHARRFAHVLQAHARALFDLAAAVCGPGRESSCVESTVVWKSSRSSRLVLATRRCASWSALRRSPPCAILPMVSCACSSNLASASSVRRSSSLSLAVSRFSHSRAISFSRAVQLHRSCSRSVCFRAPASLRCGGAVR